MDLVGLVDPFVVRALLQIHDRLTPRGLTTYKAVLKYRKFRRNWFLRLVFETYWN
jgi:hypothetical protein